jgi:hypothetical protein
MATVKIGRASDNEAKPTQTAKQTWYADEFGVPTTDAEKARTRIAEKGQEILPHVVAKYGFENGTVAEKAAKQMAAEVEADEKAAAKERAAAEKAAAKGIGEAPDQVVGERQSDTAKATAPAENKSAKK